jgi:hypothetical protein
MAMSETSMASSMGPNSGPQMSSGVITDDG